jgi:hypothetical protein
MGLQGMRHQRRRVIPYVGIERFAGHRGVAGPVELFEDRILFIAQADVFPAVIALKRLDRRAKHVGPDAKRRVLDHFVLADMGAQPRQQPGQPERLYWHPNPARGRYPRRRRELSA